MKIFSFLVSFLLSSLTIAGTDIKNFYYDGSQNNAELALQTDKTHTEYRYEQRRSICHRRVVEYTTHCRSTPQGRVCQTIPRYRTITYPCLVTVRVPYEVKDYDVVANVKLNLTSDTSEELAENFKIILKGDELSISGEGSKRFFLLLKKHNENVQFNGSIKFIEATYDVEVKSASEILNALNLSNISAKDSLLQFNMGSTSELTSIGIDLIVKKAPLLGFNKTLFDRELTKDEIKLSSLGNNSLAEIDLNGLGLKFKSGRHTLEVKAFYKYQGKILNENQFETLHTSRKIVYKH